MPTDMVRQIQLRHTILITSIIQLFRISRQIRVIASSET